MKKMYTLTYLLNFDTFSFFILFNFFSNLMIHAERERIETPCVSVLSTLE